MGHPVMLDARFACSSAFASRRNTRRSSSSEQWGPWRRITPLCLLLVKYHATGSRFANTIVSGMSTRAPQTAPPARRQSNDQKCGSNPSPSTCLPLRPLIHHLVGCGSPQQQRQL
jgi:hypothetical protein